MLTSKKRKNVLILYTGGTLGMCLNSKGALEPKPGFLTDEMNKMSDLKKEGMPHFDIIEYSPLVDSSDVRPEDWVRMANDIHTHYFNYDGFLVAHGTDTMHFTASALSFLLINLSKPVVVTGAMIPLVETYTDATRNLIIALMFAAHPRMCEVCIYFNDVLLRGNRAVKADTTVSAFISPSIPPLAKVQGHSFHIEEDLLLRPPTGPFNGKTCEDMDKPIVVNFTVFPGFDFEGIAAHLFGGGEGVPSTVKGDSFPQLKDLSKEHRSAIILEICGVGSDEMAATTQGLQYFTKVASAKGSMVVITSQTLTCLPRRALSRLERFVPDAVLVDQMTTETAIVKAMYLLARKKDGGLLAIQDVKKEMLHNLRGEMSTAALDRGFVSHL